MKGIIGKKAGMTSVFIDGKHMGVTVIDVSDNRVAQVKTT
jgi:ribosomal protein L3